MKGSQKQQEWCREKLVWLTLNPKPNMGALESETEFCGLSECMYMLAM